EGRVEELFLARQGSIEKEMGEEAIPVGIGTDPPDGVGSRGEVLGVRHARDVHGPIVEDEDSSAYGDVVVVVGPPGRNRGGLVAAAPEEGGVPDLALER